MDALITKTNINETNKTSAEKLLSEIVTVIQINALLKGRVIAIYALGSLSYGGFSPLVSDVDIGLILTDSLSQQDDTTIALLIKELKSINMPLAERISLFWGTESSLKGEVVGGRFPALDRLMLIQHGRLLAGEDIRHILPKPDLQTLVTEGASFSLNLLGTPEMVESFKKPEKIKDKGLLLLTKYVLFPVRLMYTLNTGAIGKNDEAALYYLKHNHHSAPAELVEKALKWRESGMDETVIDVLQKGLIPLYLEFIKLYENQLKEYKEFVLAEHFTRWGSDLET
jgi:hypothetical protein